MKYRPDFPDRFGSHEDSLAFCRSFFDWYNNDHYHSGIGLVTPAALHYGQATQVVEARRQILERAWQLSPQRFVKGIPKPEKLPTQVWINQPTKSQTNETRAPEPECPGAPKDTSLTHRRSGYPSVGCVPAEPASVSPNGGNVINKTPLNTGAMPEKFPGVRGLAPDKQHC